MADVNDQEGARKDKQILRPHTHVLMRPPLTPEEQQLEWEASTSLTASELLALVLMLEMGLRPHEVCALTCQAIKREALSMSPTGGQLRTAPLGEESRQAQRATRAAQRMAPGYTT